MYIKTFTNKKTFISTTIKSIFNILKNKKNYIALSGGNTPKEIHKTLDKKLKSTKKQIEFFQVDERYVPAKHPDSNQKIIKEAFKNFNKNYHKTSSSSSKKITTHFHCFDTSLSIKKSLGKYSKELPKNPNGKIKPFDLTILGIGPDGHIASLFPYSKALNSKSPVANTTTDQFVVKDRLTLTFPPILKSKNILILLKGKEKLQIIKKLNKYRQKKTAKKNPKITSAEVQKFPALKLLSHKKIQINFLNN